jgi:iron-sulfur cluster assembly protein
MSGTKMTKVITLTDSAADKVKAIMASKGEVIEGIRIGLKNAGCAGMEYTMEYATDRAPLDEVVADKGVTILIDSKALLFLIGTEMDYEEGKMSSGFVFNNPNQTDACGCGESVTLVAANPASA